MCSSEALSLDTVVFNVVVLTGKQLWYVYMDQSPPQKADSRWPSQFVFYGYPKVQYHIQNILCWSPF
jgi:hypothetical protein